IRSKHSAISHTLVTVHMNGGRTGSAKERPYGRDLFFPYGGKPFTHKGLKIQVLYLSSPREYVSILKRERFFEVPVTIKIQDLIRVLTSVWILKKAIIDCVDTVNLQDHNLIDLRKEL
ncbi:18392_t:CDS:2, partial [Acaulospora morrowiae]